MSMVSRRRILPTYLAQQCLHLVGVTLNREQQIRVAEEVVEEEEETPKVKTHTLVTSLHADCQISADCAIFFGRNLDLDRAPY